MPNITGANDFIDIPPVPARIGGVLSVANVISASGHALLGAEFFSDACAKPNEIIDFCAMDPTIGQCVNTPVVNPPTAVTAGSPGSFTGRVPVNLGELQRIGALGQTTAWAPNQFVVLADGSKVRWDGNSWEYVVTMHDSGTGDPVISSLSPNTVAASAAAITVTVNGSLFVNGSVVEINGAPVATTFVSANRLTVSYDPTVAGTVPFTVRNPNEEESNSVPFTVTAGAEEFDPSDHNIADVQAYIDALPDEGNNDPETQRVLDAERDGQARVTLIAWLEAKEGTD